MFKGTVLVTPKSYAHVPIVKRPRRAIGGVNSKARFLPLRTVNRYGHPPIHTFDNTHIFFSQLCLVDPRQAQEPLVSFPKAM